MIRKGKSDIVDGIENERYSETPIDRLFDLEAEEKVLKAAMAEAPADTADMHFNIAGIYPKKVERLTEALNRRNTATKPQTPSAISSSG